MSKKKKKKSPQTECPPGQHAVQMPDGSWRCVENEPPRVPPPTCGTDQHPVWDPNLGKWKCVDNEPPRVPPPTCGTDQHPVWDSNLGKWKCVDNEPPRVPPPTCGTDQHPVWDSNLGKWKCVDNEPPGGTKLRCPPGQKAVQLADGSWTCRCVEKTGKDKGSEPDGEGVKIVLYPDGTWEYLE